MDVTFVRSSCASPKPAPFTIFTVGIVFDDVFPITSLVNEPACVYVARSQGTCSSTVNAVYQPAFAPKVSVLENYVADDGLTNALSFTLAPGAGAQAVVAMFDPMFACDAYDLFLGSVTPFATSAPALTGDAVQGRPITTSTGVWNGSPAFAESWLRCDPAGANCAPIGGATAATYRPQAADVGHRLRTRVTATQHGSASADSAASDVIAADVTAPEFLAAALTNAVFAVDRRGPTEVSPARTRKRPKKGTTFRYTLSEGADVMVTIQRARPGRRAGKRCVRPTRKNRHGRRCTRFVRPGASS
jgi:hypothetical protein